MECIESGKVKRQDLFITSKVFFTDRKYSDTIASIQKSCNDLKLEYLDLILIHWPVAFNKEKFMKDPKVFEIEYIPVSETWSAMEEM